MTETLFAPEPDSATVVTMPRSLGVQLPLPPTANHIWSIFGNRMHRTTVYKKWLAHCTDILADEMQPVEGPVAIEITLVLGKGCPVSRDLDNCIKPVIDLLKPCKYDRNGKLTSSGAAIIKDDDVRIVRRITAQVLPAYDKKSEAEFWISVTEVRQ